MRILSVRIRNLNSLAGDWTIRLDEPAYEADGIFAITGPTGSGKSTILDAICLALYGRTPRLDKVTKSSNEIMSRQAAECLAEVRFRTPHGEYRCSWSQNKAGKKSSGNLQQPKHKLYDSEGRSLAEKTTEVVEQVTHLTGMDFQRFTQSMLLAQGRFASFLLADGDERAPLLEQITGTGIYSEISIKTHERNRAEQARLAALDAELAAQNILSFEEEDTLTRERDALLAETESLAQREQLLRDDMTRLEQAEALKRNLEQLCMERATLHHDEEAFLAQRTRLSLARRASHLTGILEAVSVQREEQRRDEARKATLVSLLPQLEDKVREEEAALAEAKHTLNEEKTRAEHAADLWKRVRSMDTEILTRRRENNTLELERETRRTVLEQHKKTRSRTEQERQKTENDLSVLLSTREQCAEDAALADAVGAMKARLSRLDDDDHSLCLARTRLEELKVALQEQHHALTERKDASDRLKEQYAAAQKNVRVLRDEIVSLLDGYELSVRRARRDALAAQTAALEKALDAAGERAELIVRAEHFASEQQALVLMVQREQAELDSCRERLAFLREKNVLLETIRSYEEARKTLRDGSPCPLCGSLHHPFAENTLEDIAPSAVENELSELEQRTEQLTADLAGHKRDMAHLTSGREEAGRSIQEKTQKLRQAVAALSPTLAGALGERSLNTDATLPPAEGWEHDLLAAMTLTDSAPDLVPLLTTLLQERSSALAATGALLQRADSLEEKIRLLTKNADALRQDYDKISHEVQGLERTLFSLQAESLSLENDIAEKEHKAAEDIADLNSRMQPFHVGGSDISALKNALAELITRRDRYAALLEEEAERRDILAECQKRLAVEEKAVEAALCEWMNTVESQKHRAAELTLLEEQRKQLFGLKNVDDEEKATRQRLRDLEHAERLRHDALDKAVRSLAEHKSTSAALSDQMMQRSATLQEKEALLLQRLKAEGFEDEQTCRAALLSQETLAELSAMEQSLAEKAVRLDARENELKRQQEAQPLPLPSREETEQGLTETAAARETALQKLGGLQERLDSNDIHKKQAARLREQRDAQAAVCRRWAALNDLIGSSDGKKFRNYAQELTFRRLIVMANRQLSFMTDRYLLAHSADEALTLNVIDRYQADAVRSSRNLSGGESFLVSLALALGLAQMAGRNVRVDSVFLDEGFGTLDNEALGVALDMLASLRRKGKMIGIISHVPAVRERVSVQIRVTPTGGGKSLLSGPGVSMTDVKHRQ